MKSIEQVVGAQVRAHRVAAGWTANQLADALLPMTGKRWTRQAVGDAEAGRRSFTALELLALATVFKTQIAELFVPLESGAVITPGGAELQELDLASAVAKVVIHNRGGELVIENQTDHVVSVQVQGHLDDLADALNAADRALQAAKAGVR